ncbi:hypothetical protein ON010_g13573 [Phytophthora cinnamomi]|nr:hypothetical protein ON010_g13573 [Phytophthora cinnamomi]
MINRGSSELLLGARALDIELFGGARKQELESFPTAGLHGLSQAKRHELRELNLEDRVVVGMWTSLYEITPETLRQWKAELETAGCTSTYTDTQSPDSCETASEWSRSDAIMTEPEAEFTTQASGIGRFQNGNEFNGLQNRAVKGAWTQLQDRWTSTGGMDTTNSNGGLISLSGSHRDDLAQQRMRKELRMTFVPARESPGSITEHLDTLFAVMERIPSVETAIDQLDTVGWRRYREHRARDIILVQDTHLRADPEIEEVRVQWQRTWQLLRTESQPSYRSATDTRSAGMGILETPEISSSVKPWKNASWTPRITIEVDNWLILNIYAPAKEEDRPQFFRDLEPWLNNHDSIIMGGDVNCVLRPSRDRITNRQPCSAPCESTILQNLIDKQDITDAIDLYQDIDEDEETIDPLHYFTR